MLFQLYIFIIIIVYIKHEVWRSNNDDGYRAPCVIIPISRNKCLQQLYCFYTSLSRLVVIGFVYYGVKVFAKLR